MAQSDAGLISDQEVAGSSPANRQHSFMEIDCEIFLVILSLPLIKVSCSQEKREEWMDGQITQKQYGPPTTFKLGHNEYPHHVKLTALDMTPLG